MSIATKLMGISAADAGNAWDIAYSSFDGGSYGFFPVYDIDTQGFRFRFKPDGTRLYVMGGATSRLYEFSLSTAWELSTASSTRYKQWSTGLGLGGFFIDSSGTRLYFTSDVNDVVYQYSFGTAWDVSTLSFVRSFSVSGKATLPWSVQFKTDGTIMYVLDNGLDRIFEYSLSTAWDISSATYVDFKAIGTQDAAPYDFVFKSDGSRMYSTGLVGKDVNEYALSTAWDVSTATYVDRGDFAYVTGAGGVVGVDIKPDGTQLFIAKGAQATIVGLDLSVAWDVTSGAWQEPADDYLGISTGTGVTRAIFIGESGTSLYAVTDTPANVLQYYLSTDWDVGSGIYSTNFNVTQDLSPAGVSFKPDGTKMFVLGAGNRRVYEYSLSTAWDVSSATLANTSTQLQGSVLRGMAFSTDGSKVYVYADTQSDVYEYNLSTAWDVSTLSYSTGDFYDVSTQDSNMAGLYFKSNGTKMYLVGYSNDNVYEYELSTAWDVTSASYTQSFSVINQTDTVAGLFFRDTGQQMVIGSSAFPPGVWSYNIT